ncbi:MAG: UDP-N-acetylglucosamine 1-carboxyvinyltransferase, partial [Clostridia bacterium]|nr:UDP-N-acetylglucosamine 1-carboxyvinyltransferase [Clostridia bacterium]
DTSSLHYTDAYAEHTFKIRASTYLIGSCLARFGRVKISSYGGCNFTNRPIDMHVMAARAFGAQTSADELILGAPHGANIVFDKVSVGATVNSLLLAAAIPASSRITPYAKEPHVACLIDFLRSAGADICQQGDTLEIRGGTLHGGEITLIGDMIEAGSYISASLLTEGQVRVYGFNPLELEAFAAALRPSGVELDFGDGWAQARGLPHSAISITTAPYPHFPTDLQPLIAPLMLKYSGGEITERVFDGRFGYLSMLTRFGGEYKISGATAYLTPAKISSARVRATDLRGGAACLMLALAARGVSEIECGEIILRGYEKITEKLGLLGAKIHIED